MEDTLREQGKAMVSSIEIVLILVLMEDTLRVQLQVTSAKTQSLNPCFNGRYS